ncbi:MAG: hypothetical protein KAT71_07880 [Gammaproteobacteria bacterium]|nr:hypothetical protein [Gammaproteobacteria bacterium]
METTVNNYYEALAYDSSHPRVIEKQPLDVKSLPYVSQCLRNQPLPKVDFPEKHLLQIGTPDYFTDIKLNQKVHKIFLRKQREYDKRAHEVIAYPMILNSPAGIAFFISMILGVGAFFMFWGMFLFAFLNAVSPHRNLHFFLQIPFFFIVPYLGMHIFRFLSHILPDNKYIVMNRRTGLVTFPPKKGKKRELSFDEFDPYVTTNYEGGGGKSRSLWYMHRYSKLTFRGFGASYMQELLLYHHYYSQFMDISKPIPDVPQLEPFRHLDPVTAEYDKRTGRPEHCWQNKTEAEIDAMLKQNEKEWDQLFPNDEYETLSFEAWVNDVLTKLKQDPNLDLQQLSLHKL